MTTPLFDSNPYCKQTVATVTACTPAASGYNVVLSQTLFFPEGGGQPGDTGTIDHVTVMDTVWDGDTIVHRCDAPLPIGKEVTLSLDWDKRFDHMQQHTGEHILSYGFWKLFGAVNVGFHMNDTFATIDLDRPMTNDELKQGELFANREIWANKPIHIYEQSVKELKKRSPRKISAKGGETPRVVEIEDGDICTCCGTHTARTGEVGSIVITAAEKNRGGTRITFLCGNRALRDAQEKNQILHTVTALFSAEPTALPARLKGLKDDLQTAHYHLKCKTEELAAYKAKELLDQRGSSPYVLALLDNTSAKEAKELLNLLTRDQPVTAIVIYTKEDSLSFFCASHPKAEGQNCRTICDLLCAIYNGKGGGKENFAQGGGKLVSDYKQLAQTILTQLARMDSHS